MDVDGREARGARTKRRLLQAARSAFGRRGYAKASVRDIARQAGVHPALVGYHFGTKRALHVAAVQEAMESLGSRVVAQASQGKSPRDAGLRALGAYLDHLESDPTFPLLVQRAVADGDRRILGILERALLPLFRQAPGLLGSSVTPDLLLSFFGAAVVPHLYAPLLERLIPPEAGATGAAAIRGPAQARRAHLEELADRLFPAQQKDKS